MATSRSEGPPPGPPGPGPLGVVVVAGGPASDQEVAAIVAALGALGAEEAVAPAVSRWRWSGRRGGGFRGAGGGRWRDGR